MKTLEEFPHVATELRSRICRTIASLGDAIVALENLELVLSHPLPESSTADLVLADYHLEEMLAFLDTAGDRLTSVSDLAGGLRFGDPTEGGAA